MWLFKASGRLVVPNVARLIEIFHICNILYLFCDAVTAMLVLVTYTKGDVVLP